MVADGPYGAKNYFLEAVERRREQERAEAPPPRPVVVASGERDRRSSSMALHTARARRITELRSQGLTWPQVAETMGRGIDALEASMRIARRAGALDE